MGPLELEENNATQYIYANLNKQAALPIKSNLLKCNVYDGNRTLLIIHF